MSHWIIYALFIYLIYKFVKGFLFPAIHITNTMNSKMKDMQSKMNEMNQQQQAQQERKTRKVEGEYIDYEEIK
ncbi:MAG: hypothetical protein WC716_05030 [Chitinophagaceae bacterium]|jgi:hypothetical protein